MAARLPAASDPLTTDGSSSLTTPATLASSGSPNPLDALHAAGADGFRRWRDRFLGDYEAALAADPVELCAGLKPSRSERDALLEQVRRTSFAIYASRVDAGATELRELARAVGLHQPDPGPNGAGGSGGLPEIRRLASSSGQSGSSGPAPPASAEADRARYVPFTNRALNWHTDGYYNPEKARVRSFILHCVHPAESGGENRFLDPRWVYAALREENEALTAALTRPDALTIPANVLEGEVTRPERKGPVFALDQGAGRNLPARLHMRYTVRKRHVVWGTGDGLAQARRSLLALLDDPDCPARRIRLERGMGVLAANALHDRSAFENGSGAPREMLRARYLDRIDDPASLPD